MNAILLQMRICDYNFVKIQIPGVARISIPIRLRPIYPSPPFAPIRGET